jgi:hypothetical protein
MSAQSVKKAKTVFRNQRAAAHWCAATRFHMCREF